MNEERSQALMEGLLDHLKKLNAFEIGELNEKLVTNFVSLILVDKSVRHQEEEIKLLLVEIVKTLHNDNLSIDYDVMIELLDAVLSELDFETVVNLLKLDVIIEALKSQNENLQILALKACSKASPPDILSNTEVISISVNLLAEESISVKLVNEIEKSLGVLIRGELIRRRLLGGNVEATLLNIKNSKSTTVKTRLLDLLIQLLPLVQEHELNPSLYEFSDFTEGNDILYTLNLIQFYTGILDIIDSSLNKAWLLEKIAPQIDAIGKLYKDRFENVDVEYFAVTEISLFFKKLSSISPEKLAVLDEKYIDLSKKDDFLLASLDPSYLGTYHNIILKELILTVPNVPIFRNLISDKASFDIVKNAITTDRLLKLPYLELVAVVSKMSYFEYSGKYLLQELPQVMNKILRGGNIVESESLRLRQEILENLVRKSDEDLDVWKKSVQNEYYKITNGRPLQAQAMVQDNTR